MWKIRSVPGLAAAMRRTADCTMPVSSYACLEATPLVPLYQVGSGDADNEVGSAVHVVATVAEKLRRLASAYGEWESFDAPAFFDLFPDQVELLLHLSEGVTMVYVTFYVDLLLPSFQRSEQYWATEFFPAYQAAHPLAQRTDHRSAYATHFFEITQPKMVAYWQRTLAVVEEVRQELSKDIGFLATAGGSEERDQWRRQWASNSARGLDEVLLTPLTKLPTLTLSTSFPLPAHRQPGRLRRLRRMWLYKEWHRWQ